LERRSIDKQFSSTWRMYNTHETLCLASETASTNKSCNVNVILRSSSSSRCELLIGNEKCLAACGGSYSGMAADPGHCENKKINLRVVINNIITHINHRIHSPLDVGSGLVRTLFNEALHRSHWHRSMCHTSLHIRQGRRRRCSITIIIRSWGSRSLG
jgi:hypothetical protein